MAEASPQVLSPGSAGKHNLRNDTKLDKAPWRKVEAAGLFRKATAIGPYHS